MASIYKMEVFVLLLLIGCMLSVRALQFVTQIPGGAHNCFYEILTQHQKYSIEVVPKNSAKYELSIKYSQDGQWLSAYYKQSSIAFERMDIHKLAALSTTYSFCITAKESQVVVTTIKFQTGLQLLQFQLLPEKSDTENLDRELSWIEQNKKSLYETIRKIQEHKIKNNDSSSLLSTKMIIFAVVGLLSIVGVNFIFFRQVKKIFQKRKLI